MNENIIITATVNGTARTWTVSPQDASEISAVLFVAGERSGNPAISNACYIFTTTQHDKHVDNLDGTI